MINLQTKNLVERSVGAQLVNLVAVKPPGGSGKTSLKEQLPFCGFTYNVRIGDPVFGWSEQIVEPGLVIVASASGEKSYTPSTNLASVCSIGNKVKLLSADSPSLEGVVVGASCAVPGGVIVDFPERVYQKIGLEERFWIHSRGQGIALTDFPSVSVFNLDPEVFSLLELQQAGRHRLMVPVCYFIPADYFNVMKYKQFNIPTLCYFNTTEKKSIDVLGIEQIKFGDFIAITDLSCTNGFNKEKGAVSIGIVIRSPIPRWNVGFGVNIIFSCTEGQILPVNNPNANLGRYLSIGRFRPRF